MDMQSPRSKREETLSHASRMRGGKLMPIACVPFRGNESGLVHQEVNVEMEPIVGRLVSDIVAELEVTYVPVLAVDALLNAADDHPGNAEIFRKRLLAGEEVFPFEEEGEITQRMGINPKSIEGTKQVLACARVAYNCAVNFLRLERYWDANTIVANNASVTPAILGTTALQRLNAVLTPEDRVNGAVNLEGEIPIKGLGLRVSSKGTDPSVLPAHETTGVSGDSVDRWIIENNADGGVNGRAELLVEEDPDNPLFPNIRADFGRGDGQSLSRTDFFQAEKMDEMSRLFNAIVRNNPQQGEEMVARMIHGLNVEMGKHPWSLYRRRIALGAGVRNSYDADNLDYRETTTTARIAYSVPVPKNEFGGFVVTTLAVKPEETFSQMPHPTLTSAWALPNHAADELIIDPVPVIGRELDLDIGLADEETVYMYIGNNHLDRDYSRVAYSRDLDTTTVEHRSTEWRYAIPLSVDSDNVIYPESLDHYPFADTAGAAVNYEVLSKAEISSPTILGPTPFEDLDVLDDENVFDDIGA